MKLIIALFLLAALQGNFLSAAAQDALPDGIAEARLLTGWRDDDGTHIAALHLKMQPGWHTYWRAPGEAGIPPRFAFEGSGNLKAVAYHWPRPRVFIQNGMQTLGYDGDVVLPVRLTARDPGAPIVVEAAIDMGVCKDICVPVALRLRVDLPMAGESDPAILRALDSQPRSGKSAGLRGISCAVEPISDGLRVTASIDLPDLDGDEVAVIETGDPAIWVSTPDTRREQGRLVATADMVPPDGQPFALDRGGVRITVIGSGDSVEILGCPAG